MSLSRIADWLQIGANVGILVGLIFVGLQISQDRHLSSGALRAEAYQLETDRWLTEMGENPSAVIAKAAVNANNLSAADVQVLDAWANWHFSMLRRNAALERYGLTDAGWRERILPVVARSLASNAITREILMSREREAEEDWLDALQSHADSIPPQEHRLYLESILRR